MSSRVDAFIDGQLVYCDGETCRVKSNRSDDISTVKMVNILEGVEFEISIEQFKEDFKKVTI